MIVALECRDHSRSVGVSQVEAFQTKCQHTGVDVGIIVSTKGFSSGAKEKAQAIGIRCLTIEEATAFDWLLLPGLEIRKRRPTHLTIDANVQGVDLESSEYCLVTGIGKPIPTDELQAEVLRQFRDVPWDSQSDHGTSECVLVPHGVFVLEISTGRQVPVEKFNCRMDYEVSKSLAPFTLAKYSDDASGREITQAAVADISGAGVPGSIVISRPPERDGGVFFVRHEADKSRKRKRKAPNPASAPDC